MDTTAADAAVRETANDLYWGSAASVNQIAAKMDLSKGSLYGLVRPLPSGVGCPNCSAEMEYPNRTAHEKGFVVCPECAFETDVESGVELTSIDALAPIDDQERPHARASRQGTDSNRVLIGTALLGVGFGIGIALWARRR